MKDIDLEIHPRKEEPKAENGDDDTLLIREDIPSIDTETVGEKNSEECCTEDSGRKLVDELIRDEDEVVISTRMLRDFFGGSSLVSIIRHNRLFLLLVTTFTMIYVGLGYLTRDKMIENDHLSKEALDWRYKSLTRSSELRERTLRSNIEEQLNDSALHTPTDSPYELPVERNTSE